MEVFPWLTGLHVGDLRQDILRRLESQQKETATINISQFLYDENFYISLIFVCNYWYGPNVVPTDKIQPKNNEDHVKRFTKQSEGPAFFFFFLRQGGQLRGKKQTQQKVP